MKNNISTVFSEADSKEVKNALKTKMPFLLSLSEDEVKGMIKMGGKSVHRYGIHFGCQELHIKQ